MFNDWLVKRSEICPNKTALIDADNNEELTYRELNDRADKLAGYLRSLGLSRGDRLAILDYNSPLHLVLLFALSRLEAIFLPLNFRLSPAELSGILKDSTPKLLLYGSEWSDTAKNLDYENSGTTLIPLADALNASNKAPESQPLKAAPDLQYNPDPESTWLLMYTGGTTGSPKGAMLSHRMVTWNALNTIISWGLRPDDRIVMAMPFFHTGGINVFTLPLLKMGGTTILMKSFDPDRYLELTGQYNATITFMVPTMYQLMADSERFTGTDLSSVRICITGGSPCPESLYHRYWERGLPFKQGYGLTEAGPNCFVLDDEMIKEKIGSVGKAVFYARTKAVDDDGNDVQPGGIGELLISGPHLFSGYWQNRRATEETIRDGWLHTGDLVRCDHEGYFYIVDRKKDMFISGGENVYPFEVESALYRHPAVAEAAVIGIPHEKWGEVGQAYVVLHKGKTAEPDQLIEHCKANLARYKVPKEIVFLDSLPKSPAGKIIKRELTQQ